jgi:hypothetical protein
MLFRRTAGLPAAAPGAATRDAASNGTGPPGVDRK